MSAFSLCMASATTTASSSLLFSKSDPKRRFKQTHGFRIACTVTSDDHEKPLITKNTKPKNPMQPKTTTDIHNVDRRDMLLGLGGLYSTVNLTTLPSAFAVPIMAPSDISTCHEATSGFIDGRNAIRTKACCPPPSTKPVKDYILPKGEIRTRPAAHKVTSEYLQNFNDAIKKMKDLPDDDPHSFKQQAMIHCAYCNGGYTQIESGKRFKDLELTIHNSWLFFPFHRWYLYFFERILGKLINDDSFAIPYWNWDNPAGMEIPQIYEGTDEKTQKENPLFDGIRNAKHLPPAIVDLGYNGTDRNISCLKQVSSNLCTMYREMRTHDPYSFFGGEYRAGSSPVANGDASIGYIERGSHTAIHRWVGNPRMPNNEDLGNFYSAGYDPLFYAHHANVDRMWKIWKDLSDKNKEPTKTDWMLASYVFYDENKELVRVYNKDCINMENLKYNYERSDIPWVKSRSTPRSKRSGIATRSVGSVKYVEEQQFPLKLDGIVKVLVKRPFTKRSKEDKEEAAEMLLVKGIEFNDEKFVKFDVFVNDDEKAELSVCDSEFAGSFAQLPHNHSNKMMMMKSGARFGLDELLEDILAEADEFILVKIVPRAGCEDVTISEIKIELIDIA